jgi:hypothetical protein
MVPPRANLTNLRVILDGQITASVESRAFSSAIVRSALMNRLVFLGFDTLSPALERLVETLFLRSEGSAWEGGRRLLFPADRETTAITKLPTDPMRTSIIRAARRDRCLANLIIRAALADLVCVQLPSDRSISSLEMNYDHPVTWQRRTLRASFGLDPVGFEFGIPELGRSSSYLAELEAPQGCEILGCDLRGFADVHLGTEQIVDDHGALAQEWRIEHDDAFQGLAFRTYPRKASRRTWYSVLTEIWKSFTRRRWPTAQKTRFGERIQVATEGHPSEAAGFITLWLSFERRAIRNYLLAALLVLGTLAVFDVHLGLFWLPFVGTIVARNDTVTRYAQLIGPSSSAVVTSLVAPGALTTFLVRSREHLVLSQLLRPVRIFVALGLTPRLIER